MRGSPENEWQVGSESEDADTRAAKSKILVAEDDRALAEVLRYNLEKAGFDVQHAFDGRSALNLARSQTPEVAILDIMLPQVDGLEICRQLRADPSTGRMAIIMLTAKSEESDQLTGFSAGADDYVVKPFSVRVLLERVRALQRRNAPAATPVESDVVNHLGIAIDRRRHKVTLHNETVELTKSEFRLLETLIGEPGRAFDRGELIESALGEDTLVLERTIDVHIRALRKKLGDWGETIETVRGVGYRCRESQ